MADLTITTKNRCKIGLVTCMTCFTTVAAYAVMGRLRQFLYKQRKALGGFPALLEKVP